MANKEEPKKPSRLKFSRLCLSQNQNTNVIRTNSLLPSSQISRFFSHSNANDEDQKTINNNRTENNKDEDAERPTSTSSDCDRLKLPDISSENSKKDVAMEQNHRKTQHRTQTAASSNNIRSTIKTFFSNENNDSLSDFEIPAKVAKKMPKQLPSKTSKSKKTHRKQPDIRKVLSKRDATSKDYSHLSEDAQLELALAMSKAESANENRTNADQPINLECYEFKSANSQANDEFFDFFKSNRKTKARFKWNSKCTQLTRRKKDVQDTKVREKIDEILVNNIIVESSQSTKPSLPIDFDELAYTPYEVYSRRLQRICISERILFEMNGYAEHSEQSSYYTNNLVERAKLQAGVLLKDWSKIPGRDDFYDGFKTAEDANDKTDTNVITPEQEAENEPADGIVVDQDAETAGCSDAMQLYSHSNSPMDTQDENRAETADDEDMTILMDSDDIQLKVNAINSQIRLSQNYSDIFQPSNVTYEAATVTRALSPDLFDDDDDIEMTEEIHENNEKDSTQSIPINEENSEATSSDVVVISSSECNSHQSSNKHDDNKLEDFDTEHTSNNGDDGIVETIDLLDTDSENTVKGCTESQTIYNVDIPQAESNHDIWSDNYNDVNLVDETVAERSAETVHDHKNQSTKSNDSDAAKKLSFTERLELFEKDVLNGFKTDIPDEYLSQSVQQSQESIVLSDDEINYSMNHGAIHDDDDDDFPHFHYDLPSPMEFNFRDSSSNVETEENLVNQSVCHIFEKTFEHIDSPSNHSTKKISLGAKSLKKVNSETVLSSRYGNATPSTSTSNMCRIKLTPDKTSKPNNSPASQSTADTRMDLSNDDYIIRVGSITPKPNYDQMDAITLEMELRKYGLRPGLRRRQAIICLDYIYNRTHPFMESNDLQPAPTTQTDSSNKSKELKAVENCSDEPKDPQINFNVGFAAHNLADERFKSRNVDRVFLPSALRAKKPWCLEPLHIAWHNLAKANSELRKAVILYEPINLLELKKYFKTIDMTFDNRDLIAFLDLHCITFRMNRTVKE